MSIGAGSRASRGVWFKARYPIPRTQRRPQYSDEELAPWFAEIAKGYSFEQAAERCKLVWDWVRNTFYSDDEVMAYALDLCLQAGALIRAGKLPVPDRHDGLYGVNLEKQLTEYDGAKA